MFQHLVNIVLTGMSSCEVYLDDITARRKTWPEHLDQFQELFCRLSDANLTINLAKYQFGKATVTCLGQVIGQVLLVMAKVTVIQEYPVLCDRCALCRFLGVVGYYRIFCKNFSSVVCPLTDLLSPKRKFMWTKACNKAFENVKALLQTAPVLAVPDFSKPFHLAVDPSDVEAGVVLLQCHDDKVEHPICYFSRKFSAAQQKYSTTEKETLALVLAIQHFKVYLGSTTYPIKVYTDHDPLTFLSHMYNSNHRLMRWSLIL